MEEFWSTILSGYSVGIMGAFIAFGYIGFFASIYMDIFKRNPHSPDSPKVFDPSYWWRENRIRFLQMMPLIFLVIILASVGDSMLNFGKMNIVVAFFIGGGIDNIALAIREKRKKIKTLLEK